MIHHQVFLVAVVCAAILVAVPCHAQEAVSPDVQALVSAYNQTALDLYQKLKAEPGNIVISPYSIGAAMEMALAGARGETEAEMTEVLHQPLSRDQREAANPALMDRLRRFEGNDAITLSIANALCLTSDQISPAYTDLLRTSYDAEVFGSHSVDPINTWVAEKTQNKIQKLLESLDPDAVCVLLNAIYLKANWASQFKVKDTRARRFFVAEDEAIMVAMMYQKMDLPFTEDESLVAAELPYKDKSLSMIVIVPNYGTTLAQVEDRLTADVVGELLTERLTNRPALNVPVLLPRFKVEFESDLKHPFELLGMKRAFSEEQADFGGMAGEGVELGGMCISQVQHKACIEVNEAGSEAAAATAVVNVSRGVSPALTANCPFLFLVVDRSENLILFLGRVARPQEASALLTYTPYVRTAGPGLAVLAVLGFVITYRRKRNKAKRPDSETAA